jgi:hypothetical protein
MVKCHKISKFYRIILALEVPLTINIFTAYLYRFIIALYFD